MKALSVLFLFLGFHFVTKGQDSLIVFPVDEQLNRFLNVRDFCISADHKEAFFTVQSPDESIGQLAVMHNIDGKWGMPELLPFCDTYRYIEPFLSADSKRLYFASDRKTAEKTTADYDIWYVERNAPGSTWSAPVNLGKTVNTEDNEFYPTLSQNNNLYLTKEASGGKGKDDIYYCSWNGKNYAKPVLLSDSINTKGYEFNAFIAPDESFLLYTRYNADDGFGSGDLYIARKDEKGNWKRPENLGDDINSKYMEYCPFYDAVQETLYFTSKRNTLASKAFHSLEEMQQYISSGENGLSKIYGVKVVF